MLTDAELYRRCTATLVASWTAHAGGSAGAAMIGAPGVDVAVFPSEPERAVYNNALLERGLGPDERANAVLAMEAAYASAGIPGFAAWVHESDRAMRAELERRGYSPVEWTRAMSMELSDLPERPRDVDLGPPDWREHLRLIGMQPGFLAAVDPGAFHVLVARLDGEAVATAIAFDQDGDCGIYNASTLERARRRGLGTALTALHAHQAVARGCRTASLQATEMAERVYAAVGFRDLGRIIEYGPP